MNDLRIAAVSYLNTYPFVHGLLNSGFLQNFRLELEVPSVCAKKLKNREVDIALVPAGALPDFSQYYVISDFCIGAISNVKTVLLLSRFPLQEIKNIYLDFDSRTSVKLVKVLAENYWNIDPVWHNLQPGQASSLPHPESLVAIGDKTFELSRQYPFIYDLAGEWIKYSGLPFVFAVWISREKITKEMADPFIKALSWGVEHKAESLDFFREKLPEGVNCLDYLEKNISFKFDQAKHAGLNQFLKFLK